MVLSIDWLQLHCSGVVSFPSNWHVERALYSTRQFQYIDTVFFDNLPFCELVHTPLSSILDANMILLKVNNARLYEPSLFPLLNHVIDSLSLVVKGISRLDLACDFNQFAYGLKPEKLINNFITQKYKKLGQSKFKIQGEQKNKLNYSYLRFGSNTSDVSSYLYNKTLELKEVKDKPYIRDMWSASGIDLERDVWRLEVSLKGNRIKMVDESMGEIISVTLDNLQDKSFISALYTSIVNQYFKFVHNTGKSNVSREKRIVLFTGMIPHYKRYIFREIANSNRADKIFIKKLEAVNCELRASKSELQKDAHDLICQFVSGRGLHDFYTDKLLGIYSSEIKMLKKREKTFEEHQDSVFATIEENKQDVIDKYNYWFNK